MFLINGVTVSNIIYIYIYYIYTQYEGYLFTQYVLYIYIYPVFMACLYFYTHSCRVYQGISHDPGGFLLRHFPNAPVHIFAPRGREVQSREITAQTRDNGINLGSKQMVLDTHL